MKKLMFLFVMMFMTSVSAYSQVQYQERLVCDVDIVVKIPGEGLQLWWRDHPLVVREYHEIGGPNCTLILLDLGFYTFVASQPGINIPVRDCINAIRREMYNSKIMPYVLIGSNEIYIAEAGWLPKSYY